jgi:hypothetical protein
MKIPHSQIFWTRENITRPLFLKTIKYRTTTFSGEGKNHTPTFSGDVKKNQGKTTLQHFLETWIITLPHFLEM